MAASNTAALVSRNSRKLIEHALLLIARQHGGNATASQAAREELRRWRAIDSAHEAAAQAASRAWALTEASALQGTIALPPKGERRDATSRRNVISLLGIAGLAAATGLGRWYWQQPLQQVALQTRRGQLLTRRLDDGSQLDLAPLTIARASLYRDRREVRLEQGEIRFDVQPDADRPFLVLTDWGGVRVLGTIFSVAVREGGLSVAVAKGRVAVWAGPNRDSTSTLQGPFSTELTAGQAVQLDQAGHLRRGSVEPTDVGAWREGWLVFDHTPLPEVVARWNDFLGRPLQLDNDPALRDLRLTGSFRVRDPATFMASLPNVLPVRTIRQDGSDLIQMRR